MASFFPREAAEWLAGSGPCSILLVGAASQAHDLIDTGHTLTVIDPDIDALLALAAQSPQIHAASAQAESLPFDPCCFDAVVSIQNFHTFAPGLALGEWARVLVPGGHVGVAYLVRDDSVPWVRKLRTIIQSELPDAMSGGYGVESTEAIANSPYFLNVETISFRLWVPCTREQLQDQARHATGADELNAETLDDLLVRVGDLYDTYARAPDPLRLPFQLSCWRAFVDQSELTAALTKADDGFSIAL